MKRFISLLLMSIWALSAIQAYSAMKCATSPCCAKKMMGKEGVYFSPESKNTCGLQPCMVLSKAIKKESIALSSPKMTYSFYHPLLLVQLSFVSITPEKERPPSFIRSPNNYCHQKLPLYIKNQHFLI